MKIDFTAAMEEFKKEVPSAHSIEVVLDSDGTVEWKLFAKTGLSSSFELGEGKSFDEALHNVRHEMGALDYPVRFIEV